MWPEPKGSAERKDSVGSLRVNWEKIEARSWLGMVLLLLFGLYGLNEGEAGCLRRPVYFMDPSVYDEPMWWIQL